MNKKYIIYLDLDGVFADLGTTLSKLLNKPIKNLLEEDWDNALIKYTQPESKVNLFLDLEPMPWSKEFYSLMLQLNKREDISISFLTSVSASKTNKRRVIAEKELWIIKNFGCDFPVHYSDSWKTKHETMGNYDCEFQSDMRANVVVELVHILIDDFILQKELWESYGGVFIHHQGDLKQSYHQLIELI